MLGFAAHMTTGVPRIHEIVQSKDTLTRLRPNLFRALRYDANSGAASIVHLKWVACSCLFVQ
jgi:hypothetical protein